MLGQVHQQQTFEICAAGFYKPDASAVTQPTVSMH